MFTFTGKFKKRRDTATATTSEHHYQQKTADVSISQKSSNSVRHSKSVEGIAMRSNQTMQHPTQRYQNTPQLVRALNRRPDPVEDHKKATGFKVFVNAFESYYDDGYSGLEL